jgi:hypothetical protein
MVASNSARCPGVQPAFKYSITVGAHPAASIIAKVLRDVPQARL